MQNDTISFMALNHNNLRDLMRLQVRETESHLIASNSAWLAQAALSPHAATFGIYHANTACGLISLTDPRQIEDQEDRAHFQPDCLYVWRLMVDHTYRGKGVGTAAIDFAQRYASLLGLRGVSLTTMDREAGNAHTFYTHLNFKPTGRRLNDEIELVWHAS